MLNAEVLMDSLTAIPLAVTMSTIETADVVLARMVVEQAQANIKGYAVLAGLAVDRGFLDGDYFWWLKEDQRIMLLWRVLLVLQEQAEETDRRAERLGIVRYRRLLKQRNRGKVMVCIEGRYAILLMHDFLDRLGVLEM